MNEVEKMYENAGIKKLLYCDICKAQEHALGLCAEIKCEPFYPPFTAEKQLELIKWLCDTDYYITEFCRLIDTREYYIETDYKHFQSSSFEETLAGLINNLWQDLTDADKAEIKNILE